MNIELIKVIGIQAAKIAGRMVVGLGVGVGIVAIGDRINKARQLRRVEAETPKLRKRNVRKTKAKSPTIAAIIRADKEITDETATKEAFDELQRDISAELALKDAPPRTPNKRLRSADKHPDKTAA